MSIDLDAIEAMTSDPYQYAQTSPLVTRGYLTALAAEVRALRDVAEAAAVLTGDPDDPAWRTLSAALDAWRAGGEG